MNKQDDAVADFLIQTWHRVYGDGAGWTAFKAAIDEGRFDDALSVLAPGIIAQAGAPNLGHSIKVRD